MDQILMQEEKETQRQYKFSLWWVTNRAKLKVVGLWCFVGIDALLFLIVAWGFLDSFAVSYGKEQNALLQSVANNQAELHDYTVANSAVALGENETRVFANGNGKYDFYTSIENTNDDWWAEFNYNFTFDSGETAKRPGFILPSEKKPLIELGFVIPTGASSAQSVISDLSWHRVDHKIIKDYVVWSKDRLNLEIKNPTFSLENGAGGKPFGRTAFTVKNNTAFSYYEPKFILLLKRGSIVLGANRTTLQSLNSGAIQDITVNWFGNVPNASQVEVIPEINLFDLNQYKPLSGENTIDTRTRVFGG